jgi:hypothetical protein
MRTYGRTDMSKIISFRNFAKMPRSPCQFKRSFFLRQTTLDCLARYGSFLQFVVIIILPRNTIKLSVGTFAYLLAFVAYQ